MTRTYSINAPVNETAERLDKALLSLTGWDSPYVKAFPSEHKLIISGKPEHFEVVEKLLAQLTATRPAGEEHPATAPSDTQNSLERVSLRLIGWLKALKAAGQLEWARKAMVPQRVAIQIGELLKAGQADDAKALAEALAELDPEYTVGCQMRDALADAKLSPAERDAKVAQLAAEAKRAFDPIIRELKLRDRLDPRLYAFAKLGKAAATRPAGEGVAVVQDRVRATVLAQDTTAATLEALRKAGLAPEGTTGRLVVGLIAPEKLADLAVLDAVRRIVPTDAP